MMRRKKEEESPKTIKFKWFKSNDIKALQEAIDKMKFKIRQPVDIRTYKIFRIDYVSISINGNDVIYSIDESVNNHYIDEWKKGPGGFIRNDIKRGQLYLSMDGTYKEIIYANKEGYLLKALIRIYPEYRLDCSEEDSKKFFEEQGEIGNLHGKFENKWFTIIKIVGANEDYSKREIVEKETEEDSTIDYSTTDFSDYQPEEDVPEEQQLALF